MVLIITNVFNFFLVLLWHILFWHETISLPVRRVLSTGDFFFSWWDFLFSREAFCFLVRGFFFPCENFSSENSSTQNEKILSTVRERFGMLCTLCLVLWGRLKGRSLGMKTFLKHLLKKKNYSSSKLLQKNLYILNNILNNIFSMYLYTFRNTSGS